MIVSALATITGILMSLGYYPQAWKIWRTRSAGDISVSSFAIFAVGTASWFAYGVYLRDPVILLSFGLGVIGSWTVLFLSLWFRSRETPH